MGRPFQNVEVGAYLMWVHYLLSQKGILSCVAIKQAPVHLQIPDQSIAGANRRTTDEQVEKDLAVSVAFSWGGERGRE